MSGSIASQAAPPDCEAAPDHISQVQCIGERIKVLDGELNRVYQSAIAAMPEKSNQDTRKEREQLRKSQRAWLKYKDENCALIGGQKGGGNLWVTHFSALCQERQLRERIVFLKGIADGSDRP